MQLPSFPDRPEAPCGCSEAFRPHYHFTPRRNWMNDPNGLVFFEGEYHLFFQHNPQDTVWGNMSWGHAVSPDLLHWRELPVAIPSTDTMIFSGSAIVDWCNVSGLGDGVAPPLLAYYTAFDADRDIQCQHLAVSRDRGRSFSHYAGNPMIDLGAADFRDPKVFYHAPSAAWVMVAVRARVHRVLFYRSTNLLDWTPAGEFGGWGSPAGQWECPDLICLRMEGETDRAHWVLKVDVDKGLVDGGSGAHYFVGDFDGFRFVPDPVQGEAAGLLADFGPDFYAAASWSDLPTTQSAPVWIAWQSNQQTGGNYPTERWRGAMSLPRILFLFAEDGLLRLGQQPLAALADYRGNGIEGMSRRLDSGDETELMVPVDRFVQQIAIGHRDEGRFDVMVMDGDVGLATLTVDFRQRSLTFQRHAAEIMPDEKFACRTQTSLPRHDAIELELFFDGSLLEIFADGGRRVWSACVFPAGQVRVAIRALSGSIQVDRLMGWPLAATVSCAADQA